MRRVGASYREIAERFDISTQRVGQILKLHGLTRAKGDGPPDADAHVITKADRAGGSAEDIPWDGRGARPKRTPAIIRTTSSAGRPRAAARGGSGPQEPVDRARYPSDTELLDAIREAASELGTVRLERPRDMRWNRGRTRLRDRRDDASPVRIMGRKPSAQPG